MKLKNIFTEKSLKQIAKTVEQFAAGDLLLLQNEINGLKEIVDSAFDRGMIIALNPSPVGKQLQEIDLSKISWLILQRSFSSSC